MGPEKEVPSPEAESARDAKMPEPTFLTRPPKKSRGEKPARHPPILIPLRHKSSYGKNGDSVCSIGGEHGSPWNVWRQ